jgi:hypothetical protein
MKGLRYLRDIHNLFELPKCNLCKLFHRYLEVKPLSTVHHSPDRPWLSLDPGLTEDEKVRTLAMADPLAFATKFAEVVCYDPI